jgi:hypothetical protein
MPRPTTDDLTLRSPLPAIPGAASLGIRITYPTNGPTGWTVALLRLTNNYYVVVGHAPHQRWAALYRHYVVPGTGIVDPRPLLIDPRTGAPAPCGIKWDWSTGSEISCVLRDLARLPAAV